tara:strand:+ start:188 stop:838 length:651 start_codon:yes stop_codon:yes gene_type:complete
LRFQGKKWLNVSMPNFDGLLRRLFGQSGWAPKALLGGALCFVPVVNFLAFGYLLEYAFRVKATHELDLPEWSELGWSDLFFRGLQFAAIFLATFLGPLLAGWLASGILDMLTFGMLGYLAYAPLGVMAFIAPPLFLASLHLYVRDGMFADAWNLRQTLRLAMMLGKPLLIPILAFWGLMALALPLYGFAFFLGSWVLIAYSTALFVSVSPGHQPSF